MIPATLTIHAGCGPDTLERSERQSPQDKDGTADTTDDLQPGDDGSGDTEEDQDSEDTKPGSGSDAPGGPTDEDQDDEEGDNADQGNNGETDSSEDDPNQYNFPGATWEQVDDVSEFGWSAEKLAAAKNYADSLDTAAVIIVYRGHMIASWGPIDTKYMMHSVRKSFMSGLYGVQVDAGKIDTNATLAQLQISDKGGLSETETSAKILDLLKARSCVYHAAAAETSSMAAARPPRYSCSPGEKWYYNNWDFNALGTIYRNVTGLDIFQSLKDSIADPIGMEHFQTSDGSYQRENVSDHPAYHMKMSAADMARYGLLYLNWGRWRDKQIISRKWIEESTKSSSTTDGGGGYGYMWWVQKRQGATHNPYYAAGVGGQKILVDPDRHLVVVHRVNTFVSGNSVSSSSFNSLMSKIYEAKTGGW